MSDGREMQTYYSAVALLCLMCMGVLGVLVWENNRMPEHDKRLLYLTYALIAVSTLVEWIGRSLEGCAGLAPWVLPSVRCVDYIVKPMAGGALVAQMGPRNKWRTALMAILVVNAVVQVVAAFNGWIVVVDASGHCADGVLFPAYLTACIAVVVLVTVESALYGRGFSRQNEISLVAVTLFILAGIAMQAFLPARPRAVCVAMAMGATLMYIRFMEFTSLELDTRLAEERERADTDQLTGVMSRHAYARTLEDLDANLPLPATLVAYVADVNGLKRVNDSLGHEAGDELLMGAAHCLESTFGMGGRVYRTGGDEFCVLANMSPDEVERALSRLKETCDKWCGRLVSGLTLSVGHALSSDYEGISAEALVREADLVMYDAKAAYYRDVGRDRRRR